MEREDRIRRIKGRRTSRPTDVPTDTGIVSGVFFSWEGKQDKVLEDLKSFASREASRRITVYIVYNNECPAKEYVEKAKEILTENSISFRILDLKTRKMTGWKPKLYIYQKALQDFERVIYVDLDVEFRKIPDERFARKLFFHGFHSLSRRGKRTPLCSVVAMDRLCSEIVDSAIKKSTNIENCDDEISLTEALKEKKIMRNPLGPVLFEYIKM